MQIIWYGAHCFKLISPEVTILTDPFSPAKLGFKNPRITSEIVIFSSSQQEEKKISSEAFILSTPGEVGIKDVFIYGFPHLEGKNPKTIFKLNIEDLKICFLGEITEALADEEVEKLGEIDILILPISKNTLSFKKALEIVKEIEPTLIIPQYGKDKNEISEFVKELGKKNLEEVDKLKIKKKDLVDDKTEIIILKPNL